jgi:DNA ligase-1
MRRFGRKLDVEGMRAELPLTAVFFDVLHVDGQTLVDRPLSARIEALERVVPERSRIASVHTGDPDIAEQFLREQLSLGHEGVMAKGLSTRYEAGSRGAGWLKIKPAWTLDLVVLAAEWGSGRRQGLLSNLHLGARDAASGRFVMLGKTFKGLTDELLAWQTSALLAREQRRDRHTVYVRPELVVEIAFNEVQASPRYPGGVALRFARVKGYRPDKTADQADTVQQVRAIFAGTAKR